MYAGWGFLACAIRLTLRRSLSGPSVARPYRGANVAQSWGRRQQCLSQRGVHKAPNWQPEREIKHREGGCKQAAGVMLARGGGAAIPPVNWDARFYPLSSVGRSACSTKSVSSAEVQVLQRVFQGFNLV